MPKSKAFREFVGEFLIPELWGIGALVINWKSVRGNDKMFCVKFVVFGFFGFTANTSAY